MSPARVLIAVAVAAVLTVVSFVLLRGPSKTSDTPAPVLQFDQARVVSLSVTRPDGAVETLRRGVGAEWVIELTSGGKTVEWPANASNARGAMQILATVLPARPADAAATVPAGATLVTATLNDGSVASMRLDSGVLAGGVLAAAESPRKGPVVWVDSSLADMLVRAGPREWRSTSVLPGVTDAARITLESGTVRIVLARVQGRWYVREPVSDAAEPETISRLANGLSRVQITDFLDAAQPPSAQSGLNTPAAAVTLETDSRDPDGGQSRTLTTSLKLGQPSDMTGKGFFAGLSRGEVKDRVLVVTAEPIAGIPRDPAQYIACRALGLPVSDIGALTIGDRRYMRALDGWRSVRDGQQFSPVPADVESISAFLKLVSETPGIVSLMDQAAAGTDIAVEVGNIAGDSVASVTVSIDTDAANHRPVLVIRSGRVARRYAAPEAISLWPWISGN